MDTDLSLIEISGEDDSLLQQIPNDGDDGCSIYSSISFSPLCAARPPKPSPFGSVGEESSERPGSSYCRDSINKENLNSNKSEVPKLSLEPQQMKRKKKGGGYDLRKSLAWDRAFFTEEGVLNPKELSMISGNMTSPGGRKLSIIHEEGCESVVEIAKQKNSADSLALQEKLFKDLAVNTASGSENFSRPFKSLCRKPDGLAKSCGLVESPATLQSKQNVFLTQEVNGSGSKRSGCPRPVASSSPATVRATIGAPKELKGTRMPVPKSEAASANSCAKSSIPGGQLKRPQPTRAVIASKNVKPRSSSSSAKAVVGIANSYPSSKSSTTKVTLPLAKRNVPSSSSIFERPAVGKGKVTPKLSSSSQVKTALEGLQNQGKPPVNQSNHVLDDNNGESSKMRFHSERYEKPDTSVPNVPTQTIKPSGLRMPSPSMGFFRQPKALLTTENLVSKNKHPSSIPHLATDILRNHNSTKNAHDIPKSSDPEHLSDDHQSDYSNMGMQDLTSLDVSHRKAESNAGVCITPSTKPKPLSGTTDEMPWNLQEMYNSPRDGDPADRCKMGKHLPLDNKFSDVSERRAEEVDREVDDHEEFSVKTSLLLTESSDRASIDKYNILVSTSSEERDELVVRSMDFSETFPGDIVLQTEVVSMAIEDEPSRLTSNTDVAFLPQHQSVNVSFIDDKETSAYSQDSSNELQNCVIAENADSVSHSKKISASEGERSCDPSVCKSQEFSKAVSAGSRDESSQLLSVAAENTFQDGPKESDNLVISSEDIPRNFTEELQTLGCQNMDHSLSISILPSIGSHDSYAGAHEKKANVDEELLLMLNKDQSTAETDTTVSDNPCASVSDIAVSNTKMEQDQSSAELHSTVKDDDGQEIGDFSWHGDFEDNHNHPQVQNICQNTSSPLSGTANLCFDKTGYHKADQNSDYKDKTSVRLRDVDVGAMGSDISQTPLEGEYGRVEERGADANETKMQVEVARHNPSSDISLISEFASKNNSLVGNLVEQSGEHHDPPYCPLEDASLLDEGVSVDHNSSNEHSEKGFDDLSYEIKLTECISSVEAQPDLHGAPDFTNVKAGKDDSDDLLLHFVVHEDSQSHLDATTEVKTSTEMTVESIEAQMAADGDETFHADSRNHLNSSSSQVEIDLPLDHGNSYDEPQPQHHAGSSDCTGDNDGRQPQQGCGHNWKQKSLLVKPPPYVPPFSDEWLAAMEAAGEKILTMKSGAVQNSPPEKTAPEPGPWSPVKKHNQAIGPFDCTKHINNTVNIPDRGSQ